MEEDGQRYVLAEARLGALRAGARRRRRGSAPSRAPSSSAAATRRCSRSSPTSPTPSRCSAARLRRRPRTAPASSTWPPASARTTRTSATPPASTPSCPMDEHGRFTAEVEPWAGVHVFDANPRRHPGPQGRRPSSCATTPTTTPTRTAGAAPSRSSTGPCQSWFVQVTAFRDRMVELNQQITWVPEHVKDGSFGKWLANARDWSISRNRFWGSPIPVWKSDDPALPAHRRLRQPRRARARLRRRGRPTCTARASTSSCGPTPTTRPASR